MKKEINVWSYLEEHSNYENDISKIVKKVFNSGRLIFGKELENFEKNFSAWIGVKYGVGVGNGTDAIKIGINSLGIGQGDEIITVSNTAVPTVSAIVDAGAKPVFCDIKSNTYNIDVDKIENLITKKTKAIIAVHLYGHPADVIELKKICKKYDLRLIEDCAQSHGARYMNKTTGSFGDLAAFSFYPTKILGGYGDGGMIVTNKKALYEKNKMIRFYGMKDRYFSEINGINSRLDEVHAAILNYKLESLDKDIERRRDIAKYYNDEIKNDLIIKPIEEKKYFHSYYLYVVRSNYRELFINQLKKRNININISYPWPIHTMPPFRQFKYKDLTITEKMSKEIFSLPMYPRLSDSQIEYIVKSVNSINNR